MPELTVKQWIFLEVARGFLAAAHHSETPEELVALASRYAEALFQGLPE